MAIGYLAMAIPIGVTTTVHAMKVFGRLMPEPGSHFDVPLSYSIPNLVYCTLYAVFGGYVCAAIARQNRLKHGLTLAGLVFVLSLVSVYIDREHQPVRYQAMLVLLGAPATATGAWLRVKKEQGGTAVETAAS